ncbi:MAG: hypothetical protein AVDCRST_MAG48-1450 [uncultured Friedmanniella sp.]|uniref:Uncharacterized protein n=1 Tax=uncultured Friedmanniella sp. TaxID=335381 RepID=A0A6J4KCZ9_9ACTN|nr:MAG: hypothetical protein AVDCRST_MAG48-1450 [uncultured Friedmanniella sp.]
MPAFFSGCLTTTVRTVFPARVDRPPAGAPVAYVDVSASTVPTDGATYSPSSDKIRFRSFARNVGDAVSLLETYRRQHPAIVTSRLHCYLPVRALGVPVDFRPKNRADPRFAGLTDVTDAEFTAIQDRIDGRLEQVLGAALGGAPAEEVYALWREVNADDVQIAEQRGSARHPLPAPGSDLAAGVGPLPRRLSGTAPSDALPVVVTVGRGRADAARVLLASVSAHASGPLRFLLLTHHPDELVVGDLASAAPGHEVQVVDTRTVGKDLRAAGRRLPASDVDRLPLPPAAGRGPGRRPAGGRGGRGRRRRAGPAGPRRTAAGGTAAGRHRLGEQLRRAHRRGQPAGRPDGPGHRAPAARVRPARVRLRGVRRVGAGPGPRRLASGRGDGRAAELGGGVRSRLPRAAAPRRRSRASGAAAAVAPGARSRRRGRRRPTALGGPHGTVVGRPGDWAGAVVRRRPHRPGPVVALTGVPVTWAPDARTPGRPQPPRGPARRGASEDQVAHDHVVVRGPRGVHGPHHVGEPLGALAALDHDHVDPGPEPVRPGREPRGEVVDGRVLEVHPGLGGGAVEEAGRDQVVVGPVAALVVLPGVDVAGQDDPVAAGVDPGQPGRHRPDLPGAEVLVDPLLAQVAAVPGVQVDRGDPQPDARAPVLEPGVGGAADGAAAVAREPGQVERAAAAVVALAGLLRAPADQGVAAGVVEDPGALAAVGHPRLDVGRLADQAVLRGAGAAHRPDEAGGLPHGTGRALVRAVGAAGAQLLHGDDAGVLGADLAGDVRGPLQPLPAAADLRRADVEGRHPQGAAGRLGRHGLRQHRLQVGVGPGRGAVHRGQPEVEVVRRPDGGAGRAGLGRAHRPGAAALADGEHLGAAAPRREGRGPALAEAGEPGLDLEGRGVLALGGPAEGHLPGTRAGGGLDAGDPGGGGGGLGRCGGQQASDERERGGGGRELAEHGHLLVGIMRTRNWGRFLVDNPAEPRRWRGLP